MARPVLYVLAGVNGAGKSSIGGYLLQRQGLTWFDPDAFARELVAATGCDQPTANLRAWQESVRRLDEAVAERRTYAFETTLGGRTVAAKILAATQTHDVLIWFCGLASPELHLARVRARVAAGGHDIPEDRIRARYPRALENLIALMPAAAEVVVYDNSTEVAPGQPIPDPTLVIHLRGRRLQHPVLDDVETLRAIPDWAKPLVEAAIEVSASSAGRRASSVATSTPATAPRSPRSRR